MCVDVNRAKHSLKMAFQIRAREGLLVVGPENVLRPGSTWTTAIFISISREAEAAIDRKRLAGDEVRACGEEEHGLGDVLCRSVAAHGSFRGEACGLQLRTALHLALQRMGHPGNFFA